MVRRRIMIITRIMRPIYAKEAHHDLLIYLKELERREGFEGPYYAISSLD